jgi:diketogulonate reductase-like aldo/keto reductase
MTEAEIMPQIMQIECHPFAQRIETRMLAAYYNMQVECWYPLGHADDRLLNDDVLSAIADAHDKSVVQIILRWHMQEGFSAIPGSTNPDHIQENISIFDFELTDEEMAQIRAIDRGEDGRYFNINYELMGAFFMNLNE